MKRIKYLQHGFISTLILAVPFMAMVSCSHDTETPQVQKDVVEFEKSYVQSLSYKSGETIKLIGYKKIQITEEDAEDFSSLYQQSNELKDLKNYFYDKKNSILRVYFPVEAALVAHHNTLVEASELGELDMPVDHLHHLEIVGRKQTKDITGVEGNDVQNGIIYLAEKNTPDHYFEKVCVFDFGDKVILDEHSHHDMASGKVAKASCMNNHGGRNCSNAFGIYKGRCTFNSNVCMDYNGWFTNCKNGKLSNFPGSDCDYALGAGHCWNEVM